MSQGVECYSCLPKTAWPPTFQAQAKKKRLLAIGAVKGFQHDSTSYALATLWKMGVDTGLWETYIKTDTQLITKQKLTEVGS